MVQNDVVPGLIDPDRIQDVFAEGFASIERISDACVRFTMYATRNLGDGDVDRYVVARIVTPLAVLETLIQQTRAFSKGLPFLSADIPTGCMH